MPDAHRFSRSPGSSPSSAPGLLLVAALAAWALLVDPAASGTFAFIAALGAATAAWAVASVVASRYGAALPGTVVAGVVGTTFAAQLSGLVPAPAMPPLGYDNANAALVVTAVAGLVIAALEQPPGRRYPYVAVAALATASSALVAGSRAGTVSCLLLLALVPLLARRSTAFWQLASAVTLLAGFTLVLALGATYDAGDDSPLVDETLSEVRAHLWSDALAIAADHPVTGVGPGGFAETSPVARSDSDLAWAHSAPMQVLAELGVVGLLLTVALIGWAIWRLGRTAAVLTVLMLQPMIDYVLQFPAVLIGVAAVLGAAAELNTAQPRTRRKH